MEEYNRRLIEEFRAGRLEPGGPLEGRPMLLLTTKGAKTGRRHTTPLMYVLDGGRLLVIASNAGAPRHPDWYRNLSADPGVTVEVGAETYEATAAELEGEERERVWREIVASYPFFAEHEEKAAPRRIPVVALEPLAG
jgi:deazaflavin-dependent oxidoreductase (nitroreductase family)